MSWLALLLVLLAAAPAWPLTAAKSCSGASGGGVGSSATWTNPTDACVSNTTRSTYSSTGQGVLFVKDWGFTIPTDATVNGITVTFNGCGSGNALQRRISANLTTDGTNVCNSTWKITDADTNNLMLIEDATCTATVGTDGDEVAGSATDYWCTTLPTPTEVNASTFGVMLRDYNTTANLLAVDQISVSIDYTEATTTTSTSSTTSSTATSTTSSTSSTTSTSTSTSTTTTTLPPCPTDKIVPVL